MDIHCSSCGRSIIEPIDFEEAAHRALAVPIGKDCQELIGVSANQYGLWVAKFLISESSKSFILEKVLNIEQE